VQDARELVESAESFCENKHKYVLNEEEQVENAEDFHKLK